MVKLQVPPLLTVAVPKALEPPPYTAIVEPAVAVPVRVTKLFEFTEPAPIAGDVTSGSVVLLFVTVLLLDWLIKIAALLDD